MKKISIVCLIISLFAFACSKTQDNSGGGTTTNPPPSDTSSLRKMLIAYNFDQSGNVSDSLVYKWIYDDQRRITKYIVGSFGSSLYDSSITSFTASQSVTDEFLYQGTTLVIQEHSVSYLNSNGDPDSIVFTEAGAAQLNKYFYDALRNDTLTESFNRSGNNLVLNSQQRNYYSGATLDSAVQSDANGTAVFRSKWLNGNIVADSGYNSGGLSIVHAYSYDNTTHPGWLQYEGTKNLLTSYTQTFINPLQIDPVETLTYAFDAANRVKTVTRIHSGAAYSKEVFTYY